MLHRVRLNKTCDFPGSGRGVRRPELPEIFLGLFHKHNLFTNRKSFMEVDHRPLFRLPAFLFLLRKYPYDR